MTIPRFIISSFCYGGGCVGVSTQDDGTVVVTDTKSSTPAAPTLTFTPEEWDAFTAGVRAGEFERSVLTQRLSTLSAT